MATVTAIILASGRATRMGAGMDKCFLSLGPKPVVAWSLLAFEACKEVDRIILTVRKDQVGAARGLQSMFGIRKLDTIVVGGARRQDSVAAALKEVNVGETQYVVIHDAARPCVTPELICDTLKSARKYGSGIAATPMVDTVKEAGKDLLVTATPDRSTLWAVQTPQTFAADKVIAAYQQYASNRDIDYTDDASVLEAAGEPVRLVKSATPNPKITTALDLTFAAALLRLN
ncbi:MAG: 2-C-methyl-D-erythritol 4-phosphate cytidylyltransferase [Kiritimatiellae bacterium]|nr:2-C-methyl-D-erythritol 4-phosphate cytidylyltransferase [Kiritimatiellia bacterium]MBR4945631.1 2-C-methyl-D-erythritol 4-phosphate cytidylyltransferase [Kiritimatiellia bacterium]MBR5587325.1 2-C-methyl-D-erythritol 4-phosphate cytidylyltransferase [Kiritimatiellia bacterium]